MPCPDVSIECDWRGDSIEVQHIARLGVTAHYGARDGTGPYVLAAIGGRASSWTKRKTVAGAPYPRDAVPFGGVLEIGTGTSLPVGDRRTGVELRVGYFEGLRNVTPVLFAREGTPQPICLRISMTRRW